MNEAENEKDSPKKSSRRPSLPGADDHCHIKIKDSKKENEEIKRRSSIEQQSKQTHQMVPRCRAEQYDASSHQ